MTTLILFMMLLAAGDEPARGNDGAQPPSKRLNFRLFQDAPRPVTGTWMLEMTGQPGRRIVVTPLHEESHDTLVGRDAATGEEVLRLEKKKEGIGYEGQLQNVLSTCGLESVPVTEYVPLGDVVVVTWIARPTEAECPPIDTEGSGRFVVTSPRGGPVRLRTMADLSSQRVKSQYNIGGEAESRASTEVSYTLPLGALSVDDGTEVRFLRRIKAPLDGSYWFEVEVPLSAGQDGLAPPKGFLAAESIQFIGSITLRRVETD